MVSNSGDEADPLRYLPDQGSLGVALRRAGVGFRHRVDEELATAGFTDRRFPDGRVLLMCAGPEQVTISDIGHALGITRQGASKIVAGLRERGYVTVTPSPTDGREKILKPTPRAVEYLLAHHEAARAIEHRLREHIGDDGIETLFHALDLLNDGTVREIDNLRLQALRLHEADG